MKLAIYFGSETTPYIIDWEGDADHLRDDFPHYFAYNGSYWNWFQIESDITGLANKMLRYSKIDENGLPYDVFGKRFPTPDFIAMFNIKPKGTDCECGAKHTGFSSIHMFYCPLWSKE